MTTLSLEVGERTLTINLFWDDLDAHLAKLYHKKLIVDKEDAQTKDILKDYISKHCQISQKGNSKVSLALDHYVYYEDKNLLQLTYTVNNLKPENPIQFVSTILFDAFDNQTNVLYFNTIKENKIFTFNKSTPEITINAD